jgi:hypothetical protein
VQRVSLFVEKTIKLLGGQQPLKNGTNPDHIRGFAEKPIEFFAKPKGVLPSLKATPLSRGFPVFFDKKFPPVQRLVLHLGKLVGYKKANMVGFLENSLRRNQGGHHDRPRS